MSVCREGLVSFVLPCRDAGRFVERALDSLHAQTYPHFEVIAIDDGSADESRDILEAYARRDERVRVLLNGRNLGLVRTLNRGVREARGQYLARMDADDVAEPSRLSRQLRLLAARPEVGLVGTGAYLIDADDRISGHRPVRCIGAAGGRFFSLMATPVLHTSMLARIAVMRAYPYRTDEECLHAEDYDLFARMVEGGINLGNVQDPLIRVRISPRSVSQVYEGVQTSNFVGLAKRHLERMLDLRLSPRVHRVLVNRMLKETCVGDVKAGLRALDDLRRAFLGRESLDPQDREEVDAITHEQRLDIIIQVLRRGGLALRLAAVALAVRYSPGLTSRPALRYLGTKLASPQL